MCSLLPARAVIAVKLRKMLGYFAVDAPYFRNRETPALYQFESRRGAIAIEDLGAGTGANGHQKLPMTTCARFAIDRKQRSCAQEIAGSGQTGWTHAAAQPPQDLLDRDDWAKPSGQWGKPPQGC